jgi:hypothetical protein
MARGAIDLDHRTPVSELPLRTVVAAGALSVRCRHRRRTRDPASCGVSTENAASGEGRQEPWSRLAVLHAPSGGVPADDKNEQSGGEQPAHVPKAIAALLARVSCCGVLLYPVAKAGRGASRSTRTHRLRHRKPLLRIAPRARSKTLASGRLLRSSRVPRASIHTSLSRNSEGRRATPCGGGRWSSPTRCVRDAADLRCGRILHDERGTGLPDG